MDAKDDRRALLQSALEAVETMQATLAAVEHARTEPIAIVGLGCRLPGAEDPTALWRLLHDGVDAVREVPRDRWDPETLDTAALDERGRAAARLGGFLERVDLFDPAFFAISPREALTLDPQQRLLLEVTWEALEDAAQAPDRLHGSATGVFVGITTSDYAKLVGVGEGDQTDVYAATGNALNAAAGRLAFVLGLHGPCMAVDTACSSSLTAIHLACQSLRAGECDLALAGGVNVILSPDAALLFARWGMLAADGRCKTFDAAADGFVRSEGCGVIVLKRLSAALAAGDRVRAVILGSAVNQDGASSGLTVPNGPAQEAVIRRALAVARLQPHEVDYVEAHGTGTPLGDPIEVEALAAVMASGRPADRPLAIGSIKTNIGHPEAASGVAGLLKVVLALEYEAIPPHLHFRERSPRIPWPGDAIYVPTRLTPWPRGERRRIAGVSSFGFSGTNAHVIVAEPPVAAAPAPAATADRPWHLVTVSGRTEAALKAGAERLAAHLASEPGLSLPDLGYTRNAGRSHLAHRAAVIAKDTAEARRRLAAVASGAEVAGVRRGVVQPGQRPRVAWLFTGQGSQYAGMGRELYQTQPVFRRALERCDAALRARLERPPLDVLFANPESAALLDETAYTQPALFALEWALAELWRAWGVVPAAVMGHSVGEIAAAAAAGVLTPEDGAILAAERGRLMQACRRGAMTAVFAGEERALALLTSFRGAMSLAAVNGPESTVVSGEPDAMVAFRAACDADGIRSKPLTVSHAFHSPMMEPMLDALEECARGFAHADPQIELISNLTGDAAKPGDVNPTYWRRHAREAVRFEASMRALRDRGCDLFLEIGPQPTLLGMGRRCIEGGVWLPSLRPGQPEWSTLLESLAELYTHGAPIDWGAFDAEWPRRKLPLPSYPFQRSRHWVEPVGRIPDGAGSGRTRHPTPGEHPLVGTRLRSPRLQDTIFEYRINPDTPGFLGDHRIHGVVVFPAAAYIESIVASVFSGFAERHPIIENLTFDQALVLADGEERVMQAVFARQPDSDGEISVQLLSRDSRSDDDNWCLHVRGKVHVGAPLRASSQVAPSSELETLEVLTARFSEEINPDTYYERFRQLGLGYGLQFRGIRRLWRRPGEALGQIQLPDSVESAVRQYCLHPGILDSAFQTLGVTLEGDLGGEGPIYVPVAIARLRILGPNATPLVGHAVLRHKPDPERGDPVADIRLFDDVGRVVAEVEGLELRRIEKGALERLRPRPYMQWLYEILWEEKAIVNGVSAYSAGRFLVLADRGGLGARAARLLEMRGAAVKLVVPGEHHDFDAFVAEVAGTEQCQVVWLGALDAAEPASVPLLEIEREVCGTALRLVQALVRRRGAVRLWLVTRGAQAVDERHEVSLAQTPLWGLGRTIAVEHPGLGCVQVDLDPAKDGTEALVEELWTGGGEDQVAYRDGRRFVARLATVHRRPLSKNIKIQSDGSYLVTGGLGGLGLVVAKWLVVEGARHLILVGRSEASDSARRTIADLKGLGARVLVKYVDVGREEAVEALFGDLGDQPSLRGVIHAAGALDDGMLLQQNWARFERVFGAKAIGAWNLHRATEGVKLDFFVLFSSAASVLGSPGQANYAAANAFLDGLAWYRNSRGLVGSSINWGPWGEVGMAARLAKRDQNRQEEGGVGAIPPTLGVQALGHVLALGAPQCTVLPVDWTVFLGRFPPGGGPPLFQRMASEATGAPARATRMAQGGILQRLEKAPLGMRHGLLLDHVREQVIGVLGLDRSHPPSDKEGLTQMGMDSLMAVELRNRLQSGLGHNLPSTLAFEYPTIEGLAMHLGQSIVVETERGEGTTGQTRAHDVNDLDALSEEELTKSLLEELKEAGY